MAYTLNSWDVGDAITLSKMLNIEEGISNAHTIASNAASAASTAQTTANTFAADIQTNKTSISNIRTDLVTLGLQAGNGNLAWNQIVEVIEMNGDSVTRSLKTRLDTDEGLISGHTTEITAARKGKTNLVGEIDYLQGQLDTIAGLITTIDDKFATASNSTIYGNHSTVDDRLEFDETHLRAVEVTLEDACESTQFNKTGDLKFASLDARLEEGERRINDLSTERDTALESTAYNKTGNNKYETIDARFEAVEGEVVGARGGLNSLDARLDAIDDNTNNSSIISRVGTLETTASGLNTNLNSATGRITTLENTVSAMDTAYQAADTAINTMLGLTESDGLRGRIAALETELDMASNDGERRLDDIEERLDALDTPSTGTIADFEDRISALETEIDMTSADSRLDTIINTVTDGTTGLAATKAIADANKSAIENATTGLSATKDIADEALTKANAAATASDLSTLAGRVTNLENEPKSATVIIDNTCITYDANTGIPTIYTTSEKTTAITPVETADYLLLGASPDTKYYYWKYIGTSPNGSWELISGGGGGTGSSSGEFAASLEAINNPNENTDYFVGNNTIGYTHYRYIAPAQGELNGTFVRILPKNLLANASVNNNGKPIITTIDDANTNVLNSFNALKSVNCTTTYDTDNVTPKSYSLSFTDINGQEYTWDLAAGGGGSSYTVQFINESGNLEIYVPNDANTAIVAARIYARLGTELLSLTGSITVKYKAESAAEYTTARVISGVTNNTITNIDVIDLLEQNAVTNIQLTASIQPEDTPITRNITYTVHRVPMSIEAYNYNPASVKTSNFNFQYYCIGSNLAKIVHFVIDGVDTTEDVGTPANTDLLTKQINVSLLERGMHSLKVYFTVGSYSSNEINTYFLYDDGSLENKPIVALSTNKATIQDGESLNLNYTVYTKGLEKTEEVTLETYTMVDNVKNTYETKSYENVDNGVLHTIAITNYPSSGTFYMTMVARHTVNGVDYTETKTTTVVITEYQSDYDSLMVRAGTANLIYEYDAAGRTNNDSDKAEYEYEFTSVSGASTTFTGENTGFNWASNGYTNGSSLLISGGATHSIDVPLFLSGTGSVSLETDTNNDDILKNGRTFEIDYEVNTATDLSAEIASFGNGLKITPSVSYLVPQGTTVTVNSHGLIEREDEICAAYLATGKRMHMVFVIEPKSTTPTSLGEYHQCVNIYINGEFVNSCPYALSDNFSTSSTFTIGSSTCIINLYSVRMYNRGLTNDEVLRNYMMAPNTKIDKINRFAANDVLDNNKLVDYNKARNKFNCLLITGEISPYKKKTKTPSGVTLTKPDTANLSYTTEFNLLDKKGDGTYYSSNNVQGTSSQTYPIHNLKVYLAEEAIDEVTGDPISKKVKYSLKGANGIGESTLCWKADYMSTDHANTFNANFANDLFVDKLPSQVADPKVQNTVYGIRCLLFLRDDENSAPVFVADGCLNNDKGNNSAFGLSIKNESISDTTRQKWEFTNNSSALDFFKADGLLATSNDDYYAKTAFESTFPDEGDLEDEGLEPNYNHLQVLMTWVHQRANFWDASDAVSGTYSYNGLTYNNLKAYKKAIFINEFLQHFNLNHALTYHLFSEFIALCDNRAKNMFLRCDNVRTEEVLDTQGNIIFSGNSNPNASFFTNTTNIGTNDDPIYALSNADQINWTGSTFAIWYPVLYDLDSCYGAENVGRITIPYDADWNYVYNNKNQFSGVDSRLWLMVEDAFATELKTLAQTLYPNSLNYNTFYTTLILAMLDSVCPAMINQDMLLKFNAYWADGFIDYSLPNNPHVYRDYKYIQRGSRAYQKDTFIKLRSNYLSSKYTTSNFMNDQIRFRSSVVIPVSNSGITVTTNQTLYPAITYGDNKEAIRSANKIGPGESVTLYASDQVGNTDTIHIGGASALTDIGDISKFEPYNLDVSGGINLKSLVVGSNVVNASTNKIDGLGSCALLETLNVRNCTGFSGTLNLSGNGLIKNVYASGSGITNIELREGGNLTNIEYGALTSTIKIINHGGLQSFAYENSANNHYANVSRLHIENTPNVPVVDIINDNIANLTAGIRLVGLDIDLFKNASTNAEIETALEKTTTFLNTIVSEIARGKYINSSGVFITNSTDYPHITGKVHITSIRASLLAKINEYYPNLIVYNTIDNDGTVNNNVVTEYTIEYRNYDNTLLYTDHRTGREHFIDPASLDPLDLDPITNDRRIPIPTKPQDEEFIYTFGSYENDTYVRFSGWVKQYTTTNPTADDYPQGNTVFIASYPTTTTQRYTVSWFEEPTGAAVLSYERNYGTDMSELTQPEERNAINRVKVVNNQVKVFKGWDRPVGKLTGNTNVYAQWEVSSIDNGTLGSDVAGAYTKAEMAALTAADLAAIARLGPEAKARLLDSNLGNNPVMIKMGHDFNYTAGVNTTDLLNGASKYVFNSVTTEAKIYDGAHGVGEVRPLSTNSDWTLALDYKFLLTPTLYTGGDEYVLASCYSNVNSSIKGFKLSLVKNTTNNSTNQYIRLTWGTTNVTLDYLTIDPNNSNTKQYSRSYRNVVVLRHKASEPNNLYVYYTAPNISSRSDVSYGSNLSLTTSNTTLTWNNDNIMNTPLILGGNYVDPSAATPEIENDRITHKPAKGIIYWAKFWDKDLGGKNCNNLAAWPHETIPFYLSGYDHETLQRQIIENTNLTFVAAQSISDRYAWPRLTEMGTTNGWTGWRESDARKLCNDRVYKGMSVAYQSIILLAGINSVSIDINNSGSVSSVRTTDYFFLPAEGEVNGGTFTNSHKGNEVSSTWPRPWPWMQASNIQNLFTTDANNALIKKNASSIEPFLYRFIGKYITDDAHIFDIALDSLDSDRIWNYTDEQYNVHEITVLSGDVWIKDGIPYIYYTNAEINEGVYVDTVTTNGGWKKADVWTLRTYSVEANTSTENKLECIRDNGQLLTQPTNDYRYVGRILCPEFSI